MHSTLAVSGDADDVAQARFRFGPPDNRAPSALGVSGVIGRSADVAILLVGLTRYTTGLQIELAVRCRLDPDLGDRMHSTVDAGLFAGVEIADGRTAAVAGRHIRNNWPAPDQPVLTHWGGGGARVVERPVVDPSAAARSPGARRRRPGLGVDESSLTVDAEALRAAAETVEVVWPSEPDQAYPAAQPPPSTYRPGASLTRVLPAVKTDETG